MKYCVSRPKQGYDKKREYLARVIVYNESGSDEIVWKECWVMEKGCATTFATRMSARSIASCFHLADEEEI